MALKLPGIFIFLNRAQYLFRDDPSNIGEGTMYVTPYFRFTIQFALQRVRIHQGQRGYHHTEFVMIQHDLHNACDFRLIHAPEPTPVFTGTISRKGDNYNGDTIRARAFQSPFNKGCRQRSILEVIDRAIGKMTVIKNPGLPFMPLIHDGNTCWRGGDKSRRITSRDILMNILNNLHLIIDLKENHPPSTYTIDYKGFFSVHPCFNMKTLPFN